MNLFSLKKQGSNGSLLFDLFGDGNNSTVNVSSQSTALIQNEWTHVAVVYDDSNESNRTLELYIDGNLSSQVSSVVLSGLSFDKRFSPFIMEARVPHLMV